MIRTIDISDSYLTHHTVVTVLVELENVLTVPTYKMEALQALTNI